MNKAICTTCVVLLSHMQYQRAASMHQHQDMTRIIPCTLISCTISDRAPPEAFLELKFINLTRIKYCTVFRPIRKLWGAMWKQCEHDAARRGSKYTAF